MNDEGANECGKIYFRTNNENCRELVCLAISLLEFLQQPTVHFVGPTPWISTTLFYAFVTEVPLVCSAFPTSAL